MIRVRHLHHRYGDHTVLDDVNFEVGAGEIFGFLGPNGAGKTTTIRILSTMLEPSAGRVEIDGIDVVMRPQEVRRVLGYMPDHAGLYELTTVREYLEFFAEAFGVLPSVVDGVMEITDIGPLQSRNVSALSKGQKQRLQLARILVHDPKVLVLDEPASDLDPRARIELRDLLMELRRMGKTIFLSSHILTELDDLCTSVAILEKGRIVGCGPISEIARQLEGRTSGAPDAHRVRVRVLGTIEQVRGLLAEHSAVDEIEKADGPSGTNVWITYRGGDKAVGSIVRTLVTADVDVVGIEGERTDLERVFLKLTQADAS